jgi:hypothetical protein
MAGDRLSVCRVSPAYLATDWPPEVSDIAPTLPLQEVVKCRLARDFTRNSGWNSSVHCRVAFEVRTVMTGSGRRVVW